MLTTSNNWGYSVGMGIEEHAPSYVRFYRAHEWGRILKHPLSVERLNDPETYVHHTAGNPYRSWDGPRAMQELQRQAHAQGHATVAYDVVVHRSAAGIISVMEGRGAARSAATLDRNEEGEAVCIMGYFHPGSSLSQRPTDADLEGIAWGIAWGIDNGWSSRDTQILGHRDNPRHPNATACPGDHLYVRLPDIRFLISLIMNATPVPPEEDDMRPTCFHEDTRLNGVFANVGGRWIPWLGSRPADIPYFKGDHPWTREQILHDQGPEAETLWRQRMS